MRVAPSTLLVLVRVLVLLKNCVFRRQLLGFCVVCAPKIATAFIIIAVCPRRDERPGVCVWLAVSPVRTVWASVFVNALVTVSVKRACQK